MKPIVVIALLSAGVSTAHAHKPSDAHLNLTVAGGQITGHLDIAVRDLDAAIGIDDGDGAISWRELSVSVPRVTAYVRERLSITNDGTPCPLALEAAALVDLSDGTYLALPVVASCPEPPGALALTYALLFDIDAQHRGLLRSGERVTIIRDRAPVPLASDPTGSVPEFIEEGVWHIWIGFDHVLFLLCLLLPAVLPRRTGASTSAVSLREVTVDAVRVVTAFTIAHSVTLVLSATGIVQLPARLVETAIALSIVIAAANNLVRVIDARWAVAFALGLLHGFGFSSVLLDLGLPSGQLVSSLFGFNLGVELGQLAIVAVVLPALFVVRHTRIYRGLLYGGSATAVGLGLVWTFERLLS